MDAKPQTVLIVDDEPALLRMMGTYLTRRGYSVATFESTDLAAEYIGAEAANVGVAVLDITMPGLNPVELGRRVLSANPQTGLIMASGYPIDLSEFLASAPGRVVFLHKPFSPEMLSQRVRLILTGAAGCATT